MPITFPFPSHSPSSQPQNFALAVGCMLASGLGFSLMNLLVRSAGNLPPIEKSFFRNAVAFIIVLTVLRSERAHQAPPAPSPWSLLGRRDWLGLIVRSVLGTTGLLANYYALDHMAIANAAVLNNMAPFFTIIFSFVFLREDVHRFQIGAILLAFLGVLVISHPGGSVVSSLVPLLVGTLGGVCAGGAYTSLRYLTLRGLDNSVIIAFFSAFSSLVALPFLVFDFHPMTGEQLGILLLTGVAGAMGQYGITFAYRFAPASRVSIFSYANVVLTTFWGLLFLNQVPTFTTLTGIFIVFAAFLIMFIYNQRKNAPSQSAPNA